MGIQAHIIIDAGEIPILASGPVSWSLREGTQPVTQEFQFAPIHHDAIMEYVKEGLTKSVSLEITDGTETKIIKYKKALPLIESGTWEISKIQINV